MPRKSSPKKSIVTQKKRSSNAIRSRYKRQLSKPIRPSLHPALVSKGKLASFSNRPTIYGPSTSLSPKRHTTIRLYSKLPSRKLRKCKSELGDNARRSAFFKAKHKGGSSSRPAHNRKHSRSC